MDMRMMMLGLTNIKCNFIKLNFIKMNLIKLLRLSRKGWSGGNKETRCGWGSTLEATKPIRAALPGLLEKYKIKSILDIGCGDLNWIHDLINDIHYTGIDWIIPDKAIERMH